MVLRTPCRPIGSGQNDDTTNGPCSASGGFCWRSNDPQVIGNETFSSGFYAYGGRTVQHENRYCLDLVLSGRYRRFKSTLGEISTSPPMSNSTCN